MELPFRLSFADPLFIAAAATVFCCLFALWSVGSTPLGVFRRMTSSCMKKPCGCSCSCGGVGGVGVAAETARENGTAGRIEPRPSGGSMMEQLVPEITTHALSYLDYPSLCRLSMTNSSMRRAANDDSAWKALYHKLSFSDALRWRLGLGSSISFWHDIWIGDYPLKDFTVEQTTVVPANGWKSYYAATKAVLNVNREFYNIVRDRSLPAMRRIWLHADYVKYDAVIESWRLGFNWDGQGVAFDIRDVCCRVLTDMAFVTMKAYVVDMDTGPFNMTNVFEFHNGRWHIVHHHSSVMLLGGEANHHNIFA
ncbi:F-box protein SKIP8 [Acorus gramineus]|uniref:F-box protein SKIP8 n=1 Tax=Acorus gramineus TaxID=55184 RepID=A0AAV9A0Q0_ACOGR|nr:F-box protein SKIP8 [Acorus gramineus]